MPEVVVLLNIKKEPFKEKVNKEHRWYDIIKKEMIVLYGGKLSFEYKKDEYLEKMSALEREKIGIKSVYRMLPKIEDLEIKDFSNIVYSDNRNEIKKWFDNYLNYNDSKSILLSENKEEIIFDVQNDELEDFCYQLHREGFNFRT